MKPTCRLLLFTLILFTFRNESAFAQQEYYDRAMKAYEQKDFKQSATVLDLFIKAKKQNLGSNELYNSACIYAMAGESTKAFELLERLAAQFLMSNAARLEADSDLSALRQTDRWKKLIAQVNENKRSEPARTARTIRNALARAKTILKKDNGAMWGTPLWSSHLLILDTKNKIYSAQPLEDAVFQDSLWSRTLPDRTLNQSNAPQDFAGSRYAVVMTTYLADSSATLIHELFHLAQEKQVQLNGNPLNYLDGYQARELLRLEYHALREALSLARKNAPKNDMAAQLSDAVCFRKLRRALSPETADAEIDIESSEGLANYTGFRLSDRRDKFALAIKEINGRESAPTYTRTFPYATGPAYGLLFDQLGIEWRSGLNKRYNLGGIFEIRYLHNEVATDSAAFHAAANRHDYNRIHKEELDRKAIFDQKTAWFTKTLVDAPVLHARLSTDTYSRSFDMNGTFVLQDKGTVYTAIRGTDITGKNFGSFQTTNTGTADQPAGILGSPDNREFIFPLPLRTEGSKLTGPNYELLLNPGWVVKPKGDKGNLEIVKQ
ncbi:hypothetical protein AAFN85_03000 [Mucilaginibacter sp. CAU 1740]|uniref:tetratricopeptide repeat protein n=1 Tax=Mucilaginibacter sp. CAU 1740 TaxID=3140365 RepID=UPI00325B4EFB